MTEKTVLNLVCVECLAGDLRNWHDETEEILRAKIKRGPVIV